MNRRRFLQTLVALPAAPLAAKMQLLEPTSVAAPVVKASPLTINQITREALRLLHQRLNFVGTINAPAGDWDE